MRNHDFFKGIGIGLVAGGVLAVSMRADKRKQKRQKQGAIKAVGEVVDHVSDMLGF